MAVEAVKMVRKIRDELYEQTKSLSNDELIQFYKTKSHEFQEELISKVRPRIDKRVKTTK